MKEIPVGGECEQEPDRKRNDDRPGKVGIGVPCSKRMPARKAKENWFDQRCREFNQRSKYQSLNKSLELGGFRMRGERVKQARRDETRQQQKDQCRQIFGYPSHSPRSSKR